MLRNDTDVGISVMSLFLERRWRMLISYSILNMFQVLLAC